MSGTLNLALNPSNEMVGLKVNASGELITSASGGGGGTQNVDIIAQTLPSLTVSDSAAQASLASIDTNIVTCDTGAVTVAASALPSGAASATLQTAGNSSLASMDGKITACDTGAVAVTSSALPTGAATSALQTAGNASLTVLEGTAYEDGEAISATDKGLLIMGRDNNGDAHDIRITQNGDVEVEIADFVKGQDVMADSFPVVIASDQSPLTTQQANITTYTSPAAETVTVPSLGTGSSQTIIMDGYSRLTFFGSNLNTSDSLFVEFSPNGTTTWFRSDEYYLSSFNGSYSVTLPDIAAQYVRLSQTDTVGASTSFTVYAVRKA